MPWFDSNELYLIKMLMLWLPLSLLTIFSLAVRFLKKEFWQTEVCLCSANAVCIPLIFCLGYLNIPLWGTQLICVAACITMAAYSALVIKKYIKNR
ncbi:MAG: hypothetical protein E7591_04200 [Ruminococcaceae bacterium]|nr:hypothetical protein [Oscillospiraceae bacterium]